MPWIAYTYTACGYSYLLLKDLAAYDSEMPVLMADKLMNSFVRSDILLTPATLNYIISRFEAVDVNKLSHIYKKSIQRSLLFLYDVKKENEQP